MTQNEIKKALYKQKPAADLVNIKDGNINYVTKLKMPDISSDPGIVFFAIPLSDVGTTEFTLKMPAQLLIRWINTD